MNTSANKSTPEQASSKKAKISKIFSLPPCETINPGKQKDTKEDAHEQALKKIVQSSKTNNPTDQANPSLMVRNVLQASFDGMGGVEALTQWAQNNPKEFYQLYIKLLALQTKTDASGDLIIQWQK